MDIAVDPNGEFFAAVGAPIQDTAGGIQTGRVYVLTRKLGNPGFCTGSEYTPPDNFTLNSRWSLDTNGDLEPPVSSPGIIRFGDSVSFSAGTACRLAVGAPFFNNQTGRVYLYTRTFGIWPAPVEINAPNPTAGYNFGDAVAIEEDTLVVGEPQLVVAPNTNGTVYAFVRNGSVWNLQGQPLVHPDPSGNDDYGISVAISGDTIVVGARQDDELDSGMVPQSDAGAAYMTREPPTFGLAASGRGATSPS